MLQLRPTFSESWYRVVSLKARLRAGAQISRQYYRGERWYVVRDPAGNQFHRLSDAAYRFVGLLDGSRNVGEAWELVGGQLDDEAPTQPEVIQILSQLHAANLLESDVTADATVLLRRHKSQMKRKMQGRLMNVLFPRIPIWDPNRFLKTWMPVMRVLLSKGGAIAWLVLVIAATATVLPHWNELAGEVRSSVDPNNWIYLWAVFVGIKFIHELGHAFACRRFGGECHEMGIMFLVFIPTPYVDASAAWAFPSRWARMFVGAAGMVFELAVASVAAFVWVATKDSGTLVSHLAYNAMLIASVTTIVFNANPLLRYDGYYILSDFLEIPNLQQKSRDYLMGLVKRHVFRVKSQQPLPPLGQRAWLFFYGLASGAYRCFVGLAIILLVAWQVPVLGILMAAGGAVTWVGVPVFKTTKYLALEPELHRKRGRAVAFTLAVAAAVAVLVGGIPFWVNVRAEGILEPEQQVTLHAGTGGFVSRINARDGQTVNGPVYAADGTTVVRPGDPIVECVDPQLENRLAKLYAQRQAITLKVTQSHATDPSQERIDQYDLETTNDQIRTAETDRERLTLRAPFTGTLVAPKIHELAGRYLPRGEEVGTLATMDRMRVKAVVTQLDAQLAHDRDERLAALGLTDDARARPQIRLVGDVQRVRGGRDPRVSVSSNAELPSAALGHAGGGEIAIDPRDPNGVRSETAQFELRVTVADPGPDMVPNQRAYVRLRVDRKPLAWQWWNSFLQLIQTKSKEKSPLV